MTVSDERSLQKIRAELLARFMQAMREDLSEWINSLAYQETQLSAENFLPVLDNGVILCQQARLIQRYAEEYAVVHDVGANIRIPAKPVYYTEKGAYPGSFVARDNVANYIGWCRELGIADVVLFESEDLVLHKNEKSVILTLMDVARRAYKFGVQPPEMVRFETEIDEEIERDKENEKKGRAMPKPRDLEEDNNLDTMVRNVVNRCTCLDRFPIKKLAEGKYQVGKSQTLIFVRIMRKHVMVRIGGGWDTLDHYILKHDPCRATIHAGNNENTNQPATPLKGRPNLTPQMARRPRAPPRSTPDKNHGSTDSWSMCSESTDSSQGMDDRLNCTCPPNISFPPRESPTTISTDQQTNKSSYSSETSLNMEQSIREIDDKLKLLEKQRGSIDSTIKDVGIYKNKQDSWLRKQMNILKERSAHNIVNPQQDFARERGYTADSIVRKKRSSTTKSAGNGYATFGRKFSQPRISPRINGTSPDLMEQRSSYSNLSASNSSVNSAIYSDMSTQTERLMPQCSPGPSRIPRPTMQRSRTADSILRKPRQQNATESKVRKRNENDRRDQRKASLRGSNSPAATNSRPGMRREKTDITTTKRTATAALLKREKSDLANSPRVRSTSSTKGMPERRRPSIRTSAV